MHTVFFDLETSGRHASHHEIIQIAAIAVDAEWKEVDCMECKVFFHEEQADAEALEINHYDPELWAAHGVTLRDAIKVFDAFLRQYPGVQLISRRGRPWSAAVLAGHSITTFDMAFLRRVYLDMGLFLPAAFHGIDTLTLATWWRQLVRPDVADLKLGTLAAHFGIDAGGAHDALADARMSCQVAHAILSDVRQGYP